MRTSARDGAADTTSTRLTAGADIAMTSRIKDTAGPGVNDAKLHAMAGVPGILDDCQQLSVALLSPAPQPSWQNRSCGTRCDNKPCGPDERAI